MPDPAGSRNDLLSQAAQAVAEVPGDAPAAASAERLLARYYRHALQDDLADRPPAALARAAFSHLRLAARRSPGRATVRVHTPTRAADGWDAHGTAVEVVTDDMPFIVDSVTAWLAGAGHAIRLLVHPVMVVRRDAEGRLLELVDAEPDEAPAGALVESWLRVEIEPQPDGDVTGRIARELTTVLADVRRAVEDWEAMRAAALRAADELQRRPPAAAAAAAEARDLLRWLAEGRFTFLGTREYEVSDGAMVPVAGSGLGILRPEPAITEGLEWSEEEARARAGIARPLLVTKSQAVSTVREPARLDDLAVTRLGPDGAPAGALRLVGLLTAAAAAEPVARVPLLRRRAADVLELCGFPTGGHDARDIAELLEAFPRDELFQASAAELYSALKPVVGLAERRQLRAHLRRDELGRFWSAVVWFPRDRFTTFVRRRMERILREATGASTVDHASRVTESPLARVHLVAWVAPGAAPAEIDVHALERRLAAATRSWGDDLADALVDALGGEEAAHALSRWGEAFPEAYKEDFPARAAVGDIAALDALGGEGAIATNLYDPAGALPGERRLKVYRLGPAIPLSQILPLLERMRLEVIDERPYELFPSDGPPAWIYDFGLRSQGAPSIADRASKARFEEAFEAVWRGLADADGFNALVPYAGLDWRQAMVLRSYARHLRQSGSAYGPGYVRDCLVANPSVAASLIRLFEARLDPDEADPGREEAAAAEIEAALRDVPSLDHDRILRALAARIQATLRTDFFRDRGTGEEAGTLVLKLDPRDIPDAPRPRPAVETWVFSPRVEGVHMRFGPVARGGIRWSERPEDLRTEVLGLVKAQSVKNAVIVPVGGKGGFVVRRMPDAADREAVQAGGLACYRAYIGALLDVTDDLGPEGVRPPPRVRRRDGDDPYLVVAADKGTASFSDVANEIALSRGFWLGDAFASGGATGYDHKAMGITARGAWESAKRHFRELGVDVAREEITVAGIGDMSGDVFGNGMLLSDRLRLVAAFDHRHVFIDPHPDPARSFAERRRLFALPRSSWDEYDRAAISAGGGVWARSAKSVPVSPQAAARLKLDPAPEALTPDELVRAILLAPVDMIWNGGIGTFVKATSEEDAAVGDKANDGVRVDAADLRARVVVEGGNLGLTQLGRIEYAMAGGKVNTDAIDNSAGVDASDHEVNIKIALDRAVAAGDLTAEGRNDLLREMTDDVAALVLRDNYEQNVALANAAAQAPSLLSVHARYIRRLEAEGRLHRAVEFLPSDRVIAERRQAGLGLVVPELAVLMASVKNELAADLVASALPDDPESLGELLGYFPAPVRTRFGDRIEEHPLRREIVATRIANRVVNRAGTTFVERQREELGAGSAAIARAHGAAWAVYEMEEHWRAIEEMDPRMAPQVQTDMRLEGRRLVDRGAAWMLRHRPGAGLVEVIGEMAEPVRRAVRLLPGTLRGVERAAHDERLAALREAGVPADLAAASARMPAASAALDIVDVALRTGRAVEEVAGVYHDLSDRLLLARLRARIDALPRDDRWHTLARSALRQELLASQAAITAAVLVHGVPGAAPEDRVAAWSGAHDAAVARTRATLDAIGEDGVFDFATLSVATRAVRELA